MGGHSPIIPPFFFGFIPVDSLYIYIYLLNNIFILNKFPLCFEVQKEAIDHNSFNHRICDGPLKIGHLIQPMIFMGI